MTSLRQEKVANELARLAGDFITSIANQQSLITVTYATVSPDLKNSTIFISVLPEKEESHALSFLKRHVHEMRQFMRNRIQMRSLPFFEISLDAGEKHRQHIEKLLNEQQNG